jgi:hypothetical protein
LSNRSILFVAATTKTPVEFLTKNKNEYELIRSYLEKQIKDVQSAAQGRTQTATPTSFMDRMKQNCNIM